MNSIAQPLKPSPPLFIFDFPFLFHSIDPPFAPPLCHQLACLIVLQNMAPYCKPVPSAHRHRQLPSPRCRFSGEPWESTLTGLLAPLSLLQSNLHSIQAPVYEHSYRGLPAADWLVAFCNIQNKTHTTSCGLHVLSGFCLPPPVYPSPPL